MPDVSSLDQIYVGFLFGSIRRARFLEGDDGSLEVDDSFPADSTLTPSEKTNEISSTEKKSH